MSCTSPFVYEPTNSDGTAITYIDEPYTVGFSGSCSIPGYSIPGYQVCEPVWNPGKWSGGYCDGWSWSKCASKSGCVKGWKWSKCCDPGLVCNWVPLTWESGSTSWCCCWTTPSVELFPTLNFSFDLSMPIDFSIESTETITVSTPEQDLNVEEFTVKSFSFNVTVNGINVNATVDCDITSTYNPDTRAWDTTIPITSASGSYSIDGMKFDMDFTFNFLTCSEPKPPEGWLNVQVDCTMQVYYEGSDAYNTSFSVVCPIISLED